MQYFSENKLKKTIIIIEKNIDFFKIQKRKIMTYIKL